METIHPLVKAADYATLQSDRWLFIMLLIVFGFALYMVGKYFVRQHETLLADFSHERARYDSNMTKVTDSQQAVIRDLTVVLTRNTEALEGCQKALAAHSDSTRECARFREDMLRREK